MMGGLAFMPSYQPFGPPWTSLTFPSLFSQDSSSTAGPRGLVCWSAAPRLGALRLSLVSGSPLPSHSFQVILAALSFPDSSNGRESACNVVRSLDWEDPPEKGTATHSSTLAWRIPRTEDLAGYSPWGCRFGHD